MHRLPSLALRPHRRLLPCTTFRWASGNTNESLPRRYNYGPRYIQPTRRPSWIDPERWHEVSPSRKFELSHAGRIEETHLGKEAVQPCHRCAERGTKCMVYTGEGQRWSKSKRCSACRRAGLPCSHSSSEGQSRGGAPWNDASREAKEREMRAEQRAERETGLRRRLERIIRQSDARTRYLARELQELRQRLDGKESGEREDEDASLRTIAAGREISTSEDGLVENETIKEESTVKEDDAGLDDVPTGYAPMTRSALEREEASHAGDGSAPAEKVTVLWSELSRLLDKTTRLEASLSRLSAVVKDLSNHSLKDHSRDINDLQRTTGELVLSIENLHHRTPDIRTQASALREQFKDLHDMQEEARTFRAEAKEVDALRTDTQDMRREVERFKGQNDDVRTLKVQQGDMRARVARLEAENETLRAALEQNDGLKEKMDKTRDAQRGAASSVFDATRY